MVFFHQILSRLREKGLDEKVDALLGRVKPFFKGFPEELILSLSEDEIVLWITLVNAQTLVAVDCGVDKPGEWRRRGLNVVEGAYWHSVKNGSCCGFS